MRKDKAPSEGRGQSGPASSDRARTKGRTSARSTTTKGGAKKASRVPPPAARTTKRKPPEYLPPEELLTRAMSATTARSRGMWARRGLATRGRLDRTIHAMLLRQLYLAYFEGRAFAKALQIGEQWLELGVLTDVAHQDIARALQALGDVDAAAGHLRLAARSGPPSRRAFHYWTLGSLYFLAGRHADAEAAMERAARWGTRDKPLYQGHLAVVQCASGKRVRGLGGMIERLGAVPAGTGYGRFVLGQLAFYDGRRDEARRYLEAFVGRTESGRAATAIALDGEVALARATLSRLTE